MRAAQISFRWATVEDVSAIVSLVESAYRGDASRAGWTTEADLLEGQRTDAHEVEALIRGPDSRVLVGELGRGLVASLALKREAEGAYVGMFAVAPKLQGQGLGRAMLREAERAARDLYGAASVRMTVIAQREELIAWYVRHGYQRTGRTEPFPYGDPRFGEPRRDDLVFDVLEKRLR